jgi:hypothetical protein
LQDRLSASEIHPDASVCIGGFASLNPTDPDPRPFPSGIQMRRSVDHLRLVISVSSVTIC